VTEEVNLMRIAVLGATGRVGSHVADVLRERGHDVVAMSRATGVDVVTGAGLDDLLPGVEAVVDAATGPSPDQEEATAFFTASARNVQAAAARAGVERIDVISIVGTDRNAAGYGAAKFAHEQALQEGPVPVHVLRATQFHEFVGQLMDWSRRGDVIAVPEMRTQLVAARTVAEAAADMATGADESRMSEIGGPRPERLVDVARILGSDVPIEEQPADRSDPDAVLWADGGLLPGPGAKLAGPTFEEWAA
jgi:uncharacterized protein YbjT (DUF2867 family)